MAIYGNWLSDMLQTWASGKTLKLLLVTSSYDHNPDWTFRSQLVGEVTGTGYTAGGVNVSGVTVSYDATDDEVRLTFSPVSFGTVDLPDVGGAVLYDSTGNPATDRLVAVDIFNSPVAVPNDSLTYTPSSEGFLLAGVGTV